MMRLPVALDAAQAVEALQIPGDMVALQEDVRALRAQLEAKLGPSTLDALRNHEHRCKVLVMESFAGNKRLREATDELQAEADTLDLQEEALRCDIRQAHYALALARDELHEWASRQQPPQPPHLQHHQSNWTRVHAVVAAGVPSLARGCAKSPEDTKTNTHDPWAVEEASFLETLLPHLENFSFEVEAGKWGAAGSSASTAAPSWSSTFLPQGSSDSSFGDDFVRARTGSQLLELETLAHQLREHSIALQHEIAVERSGFLLEAQEQPGSERYDEVEQLRREKARLTEQVMHENGVAARLREEEHASQAQWAEAVGRVVLLREESEALAQESASTLSALSAPPDLGAGILRFELANAYEALSSRLLQQRECATLKAAAVLEPHSVHAASHVTLRTS